MNSVLENSHTPWNIGTLLRDVITTSCHRLIGLSALSCLCLPIILLQLTFLKFWVHRQLPLIIDSRHRHSQINLIYFGFSMNFERKISHFEIRPSKVTPPTQKDFYNMYVSPIIWLPIQSNFLLIMYQRQKIYLF